jgi:4-amino-4-deoxy-L-arabinose transferase-like glycosyltransferase
MMRLLERLCSALLVIGAAAFVVAYIAIACVRLPYPFELEWMEGGAVTHVQEILDGHQLYVAPSLDFVPYNYTPLYYYVSSLGATVMGNGFVPLRLVSLVASLGSFVLIFLIVRRQTSSTYASFAGLALFAATFRLTGAWFDIARVDSLFLVLLLAGIYLFDSPRPVVRSFVAPCFLFLSFFTKQTALLVAASLAVSAVLIRRGYERVAFAVVFGALFVLSTLAMNAITGGWYNYYVFGLPTQHDISRAMLTQFWTVDLSSLSVALVFCLGAIMSPRGVTKLGERAVHDGLLFGTLLCSSYLVRIHTGAYSNVLMPAAAAIAIYFGIGFAEATRRLNGIPAGRLLMIFAAGLQFLMLVYSPRNQVPSPADRSTGEKLLERVSNIPGEVYWADHPWYLTRVGKPMQAQEMAVVDVLRDSPSAELASSWADLALRWRAPLQRVRARSSGVALRSPDFDAHLRLSMPT